MSDYSDIHRIIGNSFSTFLQQFSDKFGKEIKLDSVWTKFEEQQKKRDEFERKAKEVHGNKYGYFMVDYKGKDKKVQLFCYTHERYFWQTLSNHKNYHGCPDCSEMFRKYVSPTFGESFSSHWASKYWAVGKNFDKNGQELKPEDVFKGSNMKVWLKCGTCINPFQRIVHTILKMKMIRDQDNGTCCSTCGFQHFCRDEKCRGCFGKSFASHPKSSQFVKGQLLDKNGKELTPRDFPKKSNIKVSFNCDNCPHSFQSLLDGITRGFWCPYCSSGGKLCDDENCEYCNKKSFKFHPRARNWHPDEKKNVKKPWQVSLGSQEMICFLCDECDKDYYVVGYNVSKGVWCPCEHNKTEKKFQEYMILKYPTYTTQFAPKWCRNPKTGYSLKFDGLIEEEKLLFEVDGPQHFKQISNWESHEVINIRDKYKVHQALKNGYSIIRILQIDIWNDKNDWENLLDEKIKYYIETRKQSDFKAQHFFIGDHECHQIAFSE